MKIAIYASILSSSLDRLEQDIGCLDKMGISGIHWDVMDGLYVPEKTPWQWEDFERIRKKFPKIFLDVHLMVNQPSIEKYLEAGANSLTLHWSTLPHPRAAFENIKKSECFLKLALNPMESFEDWPSWVLEALDGVLIMAVNPGKGGQKFQKSVLDQALHLKKKFPKLHIAFDGGVNQEVIKEIAWADMAVCGSFLFRHPQGMGKALEELKAAIQT